MAERKRFIKASELLTEAAPLYAVADGRKVRTMIDAVRDAHPDVYNTGWEWRCALDALDMATIGKRSVLNGFQTWEHEEGRTVEDCREAFQKAIPLALEMEQKRLEAEMNPPCYC